MVAGPAEVVVSNCRSFGEGWISQLVCSLLRFVVILFVIFMYTVLEICRRNRSIKVLRSLTLFFYEEFSAVPSCIHSVVDSWECLLLNRLCFTEAIFL